MYDNLRDLQHWKRQLGITSVHTQDKDADEVCTYHLDKSSLHRRECNLAVLMFILVWLQDSKQRAAAAAAAAAAAQGKTESKTITETRRFAGRDIQVWTQHPNSFCSCIAVPMRPLQAGDPATLNMVTADGTPQKALRHFRLTGLTCCSTSELLQNMMQRQQRHRTSRKVGWMLCWGLCNRLRK